MAPTETPVADTQVLIGRQAIFDAQLQVIGYELLYRSSQVNAATFSDGDAVTARVMLNAFLEIGLDQLVGPHRAFINLTTKFLRDQLCEDLPKDRVVLEILENIPMENSVLEAMARLSSQGFTVALDDFEYHEGLRPMVEQCHMVKLDVMALGLERLAAQVAQLRPFNVKLLAEKVETQEEFEFCKGLGLDYYQGYFFSKPVIVEGASIPPNQMAILTLVGKLQNPDTGMGEIEDIIRQDVALSYKVLRYVNSAFFSLSKKVDSIRQAACLVGMARLKTWATLLVMAGLDNKPLELLMMALVRAKMCEEIAFALKESDADEYFTVGLFSVLDALLDKPMDEVLALVELSPSSRSALLELSGQMGTVLEYVLAYERGDWDAIHSRSLQMDILRQSYFAALAFKDSLVPLLNE